MLYLGLSILFQSRLLMTKSMTPFMKEKVWQRYQQFNKNVAQITQNYDAKMAYFMYQYQCDFLSYRNIQTNLFSSFCQNDPVIILFKRTLSICNNSRDFFGNAAPKNYLKYFIIDLTFSQMQKPIVSKYVCFKKEVTQQSRFWNYYFSLSLFSKMVKIKSMKKWLRLIHKAEGNFWIWLLQVIDIFASCYSRNSLIEWLFFCHLLKSYGRYLF